MEFGRIEPGELSETDFKLPREPAWNKTILAKRKDKGIVYLGCAKWGRKEWVGKLYPPKTREKDFLPAYIQHYNSIELNATHYKIYGAEGIRRWDAFAKGKEFKFCPKMYQGITHRGSLKGKDFLISEFLRGVTAFGDHLGPLFIQFSESFPPKRLEEIFLFLRSLPTDLVFFVEVRHPDWFSKTNLEKLRAILADLKMGMIITDTAGRRDCCHMNLTIPKAFIRFVGNSLDPTDYARCDDWVKRIKYWLENGLEELYFFMHMHDEAYSPELAQYMAQKLNSVCKLNLHIPVLFPPPEKDRIK